VLVVKPSSLGDIVHTLPAVACVKRLWPESRLQWIVNSEWAPLLEGNPFVDEVIDFPRRSFRGFVGSLTAAQWSAALPRRVSAEVVLDFQGLLRSALISKLGRAARGRIFGLCDAREGARLFYDEVIDISPEVHAVERYLAIAAALGADVSGPPCWPLPAGTAPAMELPPRFVLLHPFSRGAGKSLSMEDVLAFGRALAPMPVVVVGTSREPLPAGAGVIDLLNRTTIPELIWLIRQAAFVVSVDSGPMHIAAAITDQLLSIHTWSDPRLVGPFRPEAWVLKKGELCRIRDLATEGERITLGHAAEIGAWVRARIALP
jgi:ADP-heptose:LPS heptosyltransferase